MNIKIYTGGMVETNAYLVKKDNLSVLVDAPSDVIYWLDQLDVNHIDAVLITHQHYDHVEGLAKIIKKYDTKVYAWNEFRKDLTLYQIFENWGVKLKLEDYCISNVIKNEKEIYIKDQKIKILHVPGHSTDSVCFYFEEDNKIFGGDVLFKGSIGRVDLPNGDPNLLINGINSKLMPLPDKTTIYPGHGSKTTIEEEKKLNPFII